MQHQMKVSGFMVGQFLRAGDTGENTIFLRSFLLEAFLLETFPRSFNSLAGMQYPVEYAGFYP